MSNPYTVHTVHASEGLLETLLLALNIAEEQARRQGGLSGDLARRDYQHALNVVRGWREQGES